MCVVTVSLLWQWVGGVVVLCVVRVFAALWLLEWGGCGVVSHPHACVAVVIERVCSWRTGVCWSTLWQLAVCCVGVWESGSVLGDCIKES